MDCSPDNKRQLEQSPEFQFSPDDINRMRADMMLLIVKLSNLYDCLRSPSLTQSSKKSNAAPQATPSSRSDDPQDIVEILSSPHPAGSCVSKTAATRRHPDKDRTASDPKHQGTPIMSTQPTPKRSSTKRTLHGRSDNRRSPIRSFSSLPSSHHTLPAQAYPKTPPPFVYTKPTPFSLTKVPNSPPLPHTVGKQSIAATSEPSPHLRKSTKLSTCAASSLPKPRPTPNSTTLRPNPRITSKSPIPGFSFRISADDRNPHSSVTSNGTPPNQVSSGTHAAKQPPLPCQSSSVAAGISHNRLAFQPYSIPPEQNTPHKTHGISREQEGPSPAMNEAQIDLEHILADWENHSVPDQETTYYPTSPVEERRDCLSVPRYSLSQVKSHDKNATRDCSPCPNVRMPNLPTTCPGSKDGSPQEQVTSAAPEEPALSRSELLRKPTYEDIIFDDPSVVAEMLRRFDNRKNGARSRKS